MLIYLMLCIIELFMWTRIYYGKLTAWKSLCDTRTIIEAKEQDLKKQKRALDKLHESYEEDMITKQVFLKRRAVRSRQIQKLEEELKDLRKVVVD